ncbi:hypothetical protein CF319_g1671 [Tilletia indica]|nr:hypothetical protein CF319_g1671 [Tilletia indica]KAE8232776.1 hypothetical protein CF326_g2188 [Tilletia indica]
MFLDANKWRVLCAGKTTLASQWNGGPAGRADIPAILTVLQFWKLFIPSYHAPLHSSNQVSWKPFISNSVLPCAPATLGLPDSLGLAQASDTRTTSRLPA